MPVNCEIRVFSEISPPVLTLIRLIRLILKSGGSYVV